MYDHELESNFDSTKISAKRWQAMESLDVSEIKPSSNLRHFQAKFDVSTYHFLRLIFHYCFDI